MLQLGAFAFTAPWFLAAAATLPVLWWLLRVTPPSPRLLDFPAVRLLLALRTQEETPSRTPLWLILLRMLLALLIFVGLAHPVWNPGAALHGSGPLILVVDDGWAAAANWPARQAAMEGLIDRAERGGRPVRVLATARAAPDEPIRISELLRASDARERVRGLAPKPWPTDRRAALAAIENLPVAGSAHAAWLSDGIGDVDAVSLAERLQTFGSVQVLVGPAENAAWLLLTPQGEATALTIPVVRAGSRGKSSRWLRASARDGRMVARERISFDDGQSRVDVRLDLPGELRNAVTRVEIENDTSAGAVFLLDERWRRRPVGLVSGDAAAAGQPLLSSLFYLERALKPFSEVRRGTIAKLLEREISVMVLADIGTLSDAEVRRLSEWMSKGGLIIRFAGPKLAKSASGLIPVRLRGGGRALGGMMSWSRPATLAPFDQSSPFSGLDMTGDIFIRRQVLAEPAIDLDSKTWVRLSDGTPLVTAEKRENGWLVLVHTTANTEWSNLPLSGLFVGMLRRMVGLSQGVVSNDEKTVLPPLETLDGYGRLGPAPASATPIPGKLFDEARAGARSPPGFYGNDAARRALNLSAGMTGWRRSETCRAASNASDMPPPRRSISSPGCCWPRCCWRWSISRSASCCVVLAPRRGRGEARPRVSRC